MADPVGIIHFTQGSSIAGAMAAMAKAGSQCHEIVDPAVVNSLGKAATQWLVPWDQPARSMKHPKGTPETNNRGFTRATAHLGKVYQIEVVGFSEKAGQYDDGWYQRLAEYLVERSDELGIPKTFPLVFRGVNDAYGARSTFRLSRQEFASVSGWIGHQHVPDNEHWDPGALDVARLSRFMEIDMAYTLPDDREATIKDMQLLLKNEGFYVGDVDGDPGAYDDSLTRHALHAMKNSRLHLIRQVEALKAQLGQGTPPPAPQPSPEAVKLGNVVRGLKTLIAEAERP